MANQLINYELSADETHRFWGRVRKEEGCWIWTGAINEHGYGVARVMKRTFLAHRVSFYIAHGSIPVDLCILHKCDNPPCVNPDHLRLGTHAENVADKISKGRMPVGEKHPRSKLTASDVSEIKKRISAGGKLRDIAKSFGVHEATIGDIKRGITWIELSHIVDSD